VRVVDFLLTGNASGNVPQLAQVEAVRARIETMPQRARYRAIRDFANVGIVVCEQMLDGVAWSTSALQVFEIPSESMVPTLEIGDKVVVNKIAYKVGEPKRGDIVIFTAPPSAGTSENTDLVKRVVGLPGETIEGRYGRIYINRRLLDEPYLEPGVESRTFASVTVPAGTYFMLGDNRQYSKDSTFFGPIGRAALLGPATKI
jgi:signal peptidase I